MKTIAIASPKGGCGKTTTAVNLAVALAKKGKKTLIVDLDPQAHATLGLGYDPETLDKTVYHCLIDKRIPISKAIKVTNIKRLHLAPSNILLTNAEFELTTAPRREFVLADQLDRVMPEYEICVIDCPPSLGLLTLNALIASTDVVVPVQVHYYALETLKQLLEAVQVIRERFHDCRIQTLGLLLTFVEKRRLLSQEVAKQMRDFFGGFVFKTRIRSSTGLAEAPSAGQSILSYATEDTGTADYKALAEELCDPEKQEKHRLAEEGPVLSPSRTTRPKKSILAATLASLAQIRRQVLRPARMGRKVGLLLGLSILVAVVVLRTAATTVNHPPATDHVNLTTQEDTLVPITLTARDSDGDELAYRVIEDPSHGRLSGVPPHLTYTPTSDYSGGDSFRYVANDGAADSSPETVSIAVKAVNDAPTADSQSVITKADNPIYVTLTGSDVDGDRLTFAIRIPPSHGTLKSDPEFDTSGKVIYTAKPGFAGTDSFTFNTSDGALDSDSAMVSINVTANRSPRANPQLVTATEDTSAALILTGDDADKDPLTYAVVTGPSNGSLSGAEPYLEYTPNAGFNGADRFSFIVSDSRVDSDPATVSITVTSVNDPPVAKGHNIVTMEDKPVTIDVIPESFDADNDSLTVVAVTQGRNGSVTINEDSTLTYTPNANFYGIDAFTYTISDGKGGTDTAAVNITVTTVNDPPVITSTPPAKAAPDVLYTYEVEAVDQDAADSLTYSLTTKPTGMAIDPTSGLIRWVPTDAQQGTHEIVINVADSYQPPASDTQTITIIVQPIQPQTTTLTIVDGYDEKNQAMLSAENKTWVVQSRDGNCCETEFGFYTSYDFSDVPIPADSMIASVSIYVQHFEQEQFPSGKLQWSVGTGWPANPVVWVSIDAPVRDGEQNKAVNAWNVTTFVNTAEKVNSLQFRVSTNDAIGKRKTLIDHVYAEVTWY